MIVTENGILFLRDVGVFQQPPDTRARTWCEISGINSQTLTMHFLALQLWTNSFKSELSFLHLYGSHLILFSQILATKVSEECLTWRHGNSLCLTPAGVSRGEDTGDSLWLHGAGAGGGCGLSVIISANIWGFFPTFNRVWKYKYKVLNISSPFFCIYPRFFVKYYTNQICSSDKTQVFTNVKIAFSYYSLLAIYKNNPIISLACS